MNDSAANETDEAIALRLQGGAVDALEMLIDRYQAKLLRYGRKFLSDSDHVEDVVQDVFIKIYQNIQSFDAERRFSPWAYRIAHNAFVNAIRKKQREPFVPLDLDTLVAYPTDEYDPEEEKEKEEMLALIEKGLETLSPLYKEVVILYYLEELSYQEIADVLHVPLGTVGVRLRRARENLKNHIEQYVEQR